MGEIASQITSLTIVYSTVYSDADQRKHQSSASLAFVRGIHRGPVNSPHKWPVTRNMFPFDDIIMKTDEPAPPVGWFVLQRVGSSYVGRFVVLIYTYIYIYLHICIYILRFVTECLWCRLGQFGRFVSLRYFLCLLLFPWLQTILYLLLCNVYLYELTHGKTLIFTPSIREIIGDLKNMTNQTHSPGRGGDLTARQKSPTWLVDEPTLPICFYSALQDPMLR